MRVFVNGFVSALSLVASLFFFRFWRQTADRFFALFSLAFVVLGAHWVALAALDPEDEIRPFFFLLRFFAFVLIAAAIVEKNRGGTMKGR